MKRKEIIELLEETGSLMDDFGRAEIKNVETGEVVGTISQDVIHGFQTAIFACKKLLVATEGTTTPIRLAATIIDIYARCTFDLDLAAQGDIEFLHSEEGGDDGEEG